MCLVFISVEAHGSDHLLIGANREESRQPPDHVARLPGAASDALAPGRGGFRTGWYISKNRRLAGSQ